MSDRLKRLAERIASMSSEDSASLREKVSSSVIDKSSVRDNTATVYSGDDSPDITEEEKERLARYISERRWDDGPLGFVPVLGDVLQGAQAVDDYRKGDYGSAALGAGMLFLPNVLEKPIKSVSRILNSNIRKAISRYSGMSDDAIRQLGFDAISKDLRTFLENEGIDMSDITDNDLLSLVRGRRQELIESAGNAPSRFVVKRDLGNESDRQIIYDIFDPAFTGKHPNASYHQAGYMLTTDVPGGVPSVSMVENLTGDKLRGISESAYNAAIQDRGNLITGELLLQPEKTEKVYSKFPNKEEIGNIGTWHYNKGKDTKYDAPIYLLKEPTENMPLLKYSDIFSSYGIDDTGRFVINWQNGPLLKYGGKMENKENRTEDIRNDRDIRLNVRIPYTEDEARAYRQRYAESTFRDDQTSSKGAVGPWQIRPVTYKDYLNHGGKPVDLKKEAEARKVRDFTLEQAKVYLRDTWSDDDPEEVRLAKQYAAYNMGATKLRNHLREKRKEGIDINTSMDWLEGLPGETREYLDWIVYGKDINDGNRKQTKHLDKYKETFEEKIGLTFPENIPAPVDESSWPIIEPYKWGKGGLLKTAPEQQKVTDLFNKINASKHRDKLVEYACGGRMKRKKR